MVKNLKESTGEAIGEVERRQRVQRVEREREVYRMRKESGSPSHINKHTKQTLDPTAEEHNPSEGDTWQKSRGIT